MNTPDLIKASVSRQRAAEQKGETYAPAYAVRMARIAKVKDVLNYAFYGTLGAVLIIGFFYTVAILGGK